MAQLMNQMIGHAPVKQWLLQQIANQAMPSSIIFHGPSGVGKKSIAVAALQIMNCREEELACGKCSNCLRVMEDKNEMIYLLELEEKKSIGVDQVREMQSFFQLKSNHPARFVIVDPADKLSVPAANSLLKVLEEPPEGTHFILVTDQIRRLLPTIRSRSHILSFAALQPKELQEHQEFSDLALSWSDGRLQMAIDLQTEDKVASLNESIQLFYSVLCEWPADWKKRAPWFFADNQEREFCLNIWKQALEKRLYKTSENLDFIPDDPGKISRIYECLESLQSDIKANVDKVLALENFYYRARPVMLEA